MGTCHNGSLPALALLAAGGIRAPLGNELLERPEKERLPVGLGHGKVDQIAHLRFGVLGQKLGGVRGLVVLKTGALGAAKLAVEVCNELKRLYLTKLRDGAHRQTR